MTDRRRIITIGVSGHRMDQIAPDSVTSIQSTIEDVLANLERVGDTDISWTLASALAEGTDRIAADAALARNWRLIAPLPFAPERYVKDFSQEQSKQEFRRLLDAAKRSWVAQSLPDSPDDGYAAVGKALVDCSHGLISVWNGTPPRGPGGTANVIEAMRSAGGAVVWIDVARPKNISLLPPYRKAKPGTRKRWISDKVAQIWEPSILPD